MTEAEWLACEDPRPMLTFIGDRASDRKLRLFCLACCARITTHFTDDRSRAAVAFLDRHADTGGIRQKGAAAVRKAASVAQTEAYRWMSAAPDPLRKAAGLVTSNAAAAAHCSLDPDGTQAAQYTAAFGAHAAAWEWLIANRPDLLPEFDRSAGEEERRHQVGLLRDIFGNPFRPVVFPPSWRTDTALALARQMYDAREFSAMPILADALQDAGCDSDDVLNHCRGPGPHVRGCWVCDLVLGKE
jgi:hypothetical protein